MRHNGHRVIKITRSASSMFCVKYSEVKDGDLKTLISHEFFPSLKKHGIYSITTKNDRVLICFLDDKQKFYTLTIPRYKMDQDIVSLVDGIFSDGPMKLNSEIKLLESIMKRIGTNTPFSDIEGFFQENNMSECLIYIRNKIMSSGTIINNKIEGKLVALLLDPRIGYLHKSPGIKFMNLHPLHKRKDNEIAL